MLNEMLEKFNDAVKEETRANWEYVIVKPYVAMTWVWETGWGNTWESTSGNLIITLLSISSCIFCESSCWPGGAPGAGLPMNGDSSKRSIEASWKTKQNKTKSYYENHIQHRPLNAASAVYRRLCSIWSAVSILKVVAAVDLSFARVAFWVLKLVH